MFSFRHDTNGIGLLCSSSTGTFTQQVSWQLLPRAAARHKSSPGGWTAVGDWTCRPGKQCSEMCMAEHQHQNLLLLPMLRCYLASFFCWPCRCCLPTLLLLLQSTGSSSSDHCRNTHCEQRTHEICCQRAKTGKLQNHATLLLRGSHNMTAWHQP